MSDLGSFNRISLKWALACMAVALALAIVLDRTIAGGKAKAIFLGVFVVAFIGKTFLPQIHNVRLITLLAVLSGLHLTLVFIVPDDATYPGALLLPIGLLEIASIYAVAVRVLHVDDSNGK